MTHHGHPDTPPFPQPPRPGSPPNGPTFGLLGPFGAGNLGDAAIQDATIQLIRSLRPDAHFLAICPNPDDAQARHGIDGIPLNPAAAQPQPPPWLRNLLKNNSRTLVRRLLRRIAWELHRGARGARFLATAWNRLGRLDVLVLSGGGQIDDFWGGPWAHPFSLALWTTLARLRHRQAVALALGGSSLRHPLSRLFVRHALRLSNPRSFRDEPTRAFVTNLGVPEPNRTVPDLAFAYPYAPANQHPRNPPVVGICPIAAEAWTTPDDPAPARLLDALECLARDRLDRGWTVHLFASQIVADTPVVHEIARRLHAFPHLGGAARLRTIPVDSVSGFLAAAASVDVLVAARLHAVLLSLVATTPAIAICYEPKVRALMNQVGLSPYALDLVAADAPRLANTIDTAFDQRRLLSAQIASAVAAFRSQLLDHIRSDLLPFVPSRAAASSRSSSRLPLDHTP